MDKYLGGGGIGIENTQDPLVLPQVECCLIFSFFAYPILYWQIEHVPLCFRPLVNLPSPLFCQHKVVTDLDFSGLCKYAVVWENLV